LGCEPTQRRPALKLKPENELDLLLNHTPLEPDLDWANEKKRIEKLSWWKEYGLPSDGKAWHFHLMGLLGNFTYPADENDLKWLNVPYGQLTFDVEGNDFEDASHPSHRYFSRIVHWPGGVSGVTIGRGYDLGQQPDPKTDLANAGVREPLLSWLVGAKGKQGQAAKAYLNNASKEIRLHTITRKQQYKLFISVYEVMKQSVLSISRGGVNQKDYGILSWDSVSKKYKISSSIYDIAATITSRPESLFRSHLLKMIWRRSSKRFPEKVIGKACHRRDSPKGFVTWRVSDEVCFLSDFYIVPSVLFEWRNCC
jgi:hypothetical protein